jgi:putative ABC transport system permease protein
MKKIWMLSLANIRKSRSAAVSLFLIIFVAAVLMNLGILSLTNYKKSFDQKVEELNSPHAVVTIMKEFYQDKYEDYFQSYPGVEAVERTDMIFLSPVKYKFGTGDISIPAFFLDADLPQQMSPFTLVGEHKEEGDRDIYVSDLLQTGGGYELGDEFVVNYRGNTYSFRIAGFTEDIFLGSSNAGCIGFHLPEASYRRFYEETQAYGVDGVMLKVRLADSDQAENMLAGFKKSGFQKDQGVFAAHSWDNILSTIKMARTSTADIGGSIITSFALIIVLVSLLVVRFRINTSVEDNITDIGALKAIGYTSRQIMAAFILQFIQITFCGAVAGIAVSYTVVGSLSGMFSAQTGIIWNQGFDIRSSMLSLIMILILVFAAAALSVRRIRKLHPITALREGITTHSFKKNYYPLDKSKGSISFLLAMKYLLHNVKQNIMIVMIITAISFASVFGIVMFYNIALKDDAFIDMMGVEMCSVMATVDTKADAVGMCKEIQELEGVRKAINYNYGGVMIDQEDCQVYITDDFSLLDNDIVYEGRNPVYDNEISISGFVAEKYHKALGDTLTLVMNGNEAHYLITGLIQTSNNMGMGINITTAGVRRMDPEFKFDTINIYLEEGMDAGSFDEALMKKYGDRLALTTNMDNLKKSQLGVYVSIVTIFNSIILVVTILLVIMILYLIIKAMIIRRKKEFGIQKAIGYTTYQLMTQTAISYFPIILLGTIAGSILGSVYMNPILSLLFRGIGVMKVNFEIPLLWIGIMCIGISLVAYTVSMLVSFRIRKISPYALIVE